MSDAHDHEPGSAHALRLGAFADAATAVLNSPSRCGTALFDALHECWQSLQHVPGHLAPYRDDPREAVEHFEEARRQLGWALREVAALERAVREGAAREEQRSAAGAAFGSAVTERGSRGGHLEAADRGEPTEQGERGSPVEQGDEARAGEPSPGTFEAADGTAGSDTLDPVNTVEQPVDPVTPVPVVEAGKLPESSAVAADTPDASGPTASVADGTEMSMRSGGVADGTEASESPHHAPVEAEGVASEDGDPDSSAPGAATSDPATPAPTPTGSTTPGTATPAPKAAPPVTAVDPLAEFAGVLERLESDLRSEQVRFLPHPAPARRDGPDADPAVTVRRTWQRVHMALLRLPDDVAAEWRATSAATAADAGHPVPDEDARDPDVIVPGLPDDVCPAERLPLDFADLPAAAMEVDPRFHESLGLSAAEIGKLPSGDPRPAWAVRAAQAVRLAGLDPELHIALYHDHQPGSLAARKNLDSYERRLTSLLLTAGQGLDEKLAWTQESKLGAAHNLDMLLGGLVHKRPAAPDSWWYQWRTRVSRILVPLAADANYEVILRPLEDLRRDFVREYTIEETVKGVAGSSEPEVQWVVWTALRRQKGKGFGPNKHKGRVVVRPAEPTWR